MTSETKPDASAESPPTREEKEERAFVSEMVALSLSGVIIRKGMVSVRMFSVGGSKTIVCYLMQESDDGFIVALPASLSSTGEDVVADFISPTSLVKLFKTGTSMMAVPPPSILYHFLRLSKSKFSTLPGYFNQERKSQVDALMSQLETNFDIKLSSVSKSKTNTQDDDSSFSKEPPEDTFFVHSKTTKYRH